MQEEDKRYTKEEIIELVNEMADGFTKDIGDKLSQAKFIEIHKTSFIKRSLSEHEYVAWNAIHAGFSHFQVMLFNKLGRETALLEINPFTGVRKDGPVVDH